MLTSSYIHLPSIGPITEAKMWEAGALTWEEALEMPRELLPVRRDITGELLESIDRLADDDLEWFAERLPSNELWRIYPHVSSIAYIDIETNGGSVDSWGMITTISLWDGKSLRHYVNGENLKDFQDDILDYQVVATFNGSSFDLPYIASWFGTPLLQPHIDLRFLLRSVGLRGGLKACEVQCGIDRGPLNGVDGEYAVALWREYTGNGNRGALQTLLSYNALDVINLERLIVEGYNRKVADTPFAFTHELNPPEEPKGIDLTVDEEALARIRERIDERENNLRDFARQLLGG